MDDLLALAVLAGFVLVSVLVIAAGGTRLHRLWWAGSVGSGVVVAGLAASLELISFPEMLPQQLGLALAGVLGFLAGTDVQVLVGIPLRRSGGLPAVVAGAILGPIVIVGGYWLLVR